MINERTALVQRWLDSSEFSLATAYPNKKYTPVSGNPFAKLTFLGVNQDPLEIGGTPTNTDTSIFQVLLKYPVEKGDQAAIKKADEINQVYKRGVQLTHNGTVVNITTVDIGGGFNSDGWYALPISINWTAYTC